MSALYCELGASPDADQFIGPTFDWCMRYDSSAGVPSGFSTLTKKASLWQFPPFPGVHVMKAPEPLGVTLMLSGVLGRSRCSSVGVGVMVAVGFEVGEGV